MVFPFVFPFRVCPDYQRTRAATLSQIKADFSPCAMDQPLTQGVRLGL
jgi:hypothetical protein